MHAEQLNQRFDGAIHRTSHRLKECKLEEVTVVMLAVVTELSAEIAGAAGRKAGIGGLSVTCGDRRSFAANGEGWGRC